MLVLSRRKSEIIDVTAPGGVPITITVVEIRGDKVRIGIDAPGSVRINRREVTLRVNGEPADEIEAELAELRNGKPATF